MSLALATRGFLGSGGGAAAMGRLYYTDIEALVRQLCFEGTTDEGLFAGDISGFINAAYRSLYIEIVEASPSFFEKTSAALSITADGLDFGFNVIEESGVYRVTGLELQDAAGNWIPIDPVDRREVGLRQGPAATINGNGWSFSGWYQQNFKVYLYPSPGSAQTARLVYVPEPTDLAGSAVYPFAGNLASFHRLIAYEAALLALDKDHLPATLRTSAQMMKGQLLRHIRRNQAQKPRRVKRVDWDEF